MRKNGLYPRRRGRRTSARAPAMRHGAAGGGSKPPGGFDARQRLDYLAIVIKRGEVSMSSMAVTRFGRVRSLRAPPPWLPASCAGLFAAALLIAIAPAMATTYKWTDANGRVIYSDQPPTGNFKVEAIDAPPPPANPNAVKELANKDAELKKQRLLRTEEEAKAAKDARRGQPEARAVREDPRPDQPPWRSPTRSSSTRPMRRASARPWTMRLASGNVSVLEAWVQGELQGLVGNGPYVHCVGQSRFLLRASQLSCGPRPGVRCLPRRRFTSSRGSSG